MTLKGLAVLFFKGTPLMPDVLCLPGRLLIKKGTNLERYVRTLLS